MFRPTPIALHSHSVASFNTEQLPVSSPAGIFFYGRPAKFCMFCVGLRWAVCPLWPSDEIAKPENEKQLIPGSLLIIRAELSCLAYQPS